MSSTVDPRKKRGVPGNVIEEQRLQDEYVRRVGTGWLELVQLLERASREGFEVYRITLKPVWGSGGEMLVVLAAKGQDGAVVAFHGADESGFVWASLAKRIVGDRLAWRVDEYAK